MASSSRGSAPLQPQRYELIVYCDDDVTPINLTMPRPPSPPTCAEFKTSLAAALHGKVHLPATSSGQQDGTGPIALKVSIWSPVEKTYAPFVSPKTQLDPFGGRGQLWVEFQQPARLVSIAAGSEDFAMLEN